MEFETFKQKQQDHFAAISGDQEVLFLAGVDKDVLWETYLNSFPPGTNEVYRERREFDCSCCRHFVKQFGAVVFIRENKLVTIWDFLPADETFSPVVGALSEMVKSTPIQDVFVTKQENFGTDKSHEMREDESVHTWHHFFISLDDRFVLRSTLSESAVQAGYRDARNVFKRSLEEISREAFATVLDLISEKSLYKGEEWQSVLSKFLGLHDEYHALPEDERENYCWKKSTEIGGAVSKIRNHSIGVLLQDITAGVEIDEAVRKYEVIVAPQNYKRPKPIFTAKMVEKAQAEVERLGLLDSLGRRHARLSDISVGNVLWVNRDVASHMDGAGGVFEVLKQEVSVNPKKYDLPGISIDEFLEDVLPGTRDFQILLENRLESSLVSVIAPANSLSPTLFKWDNAFSWAYNGNVADSMKQRVKAAGGNVEGVLRFSLQWNTERDNLNDYDAHCIEPDKNHIWFSNKGQRHPSSGMLDVDIIHPTREQVAVENITWVDPVRMGEGEYKFFVHNYSHRGGRSGFDAEIEFDGNLYEFAYHKELAQDENVAVARVGFDRADGFSLIDSLPSTASTKTVWGLQTNRFHPVSLFMFSPNYWDGQKGVGHRHFFFMLAGCENDGRPNGFFNEYLREDFMPHRKVFEALGSKMRVEPASDQLSGLGFSSTKRNSLICKADGRPIKVVF